MSNRGKVDVLLGLQWGDEGKGKIVDVMASSYQVIARFQGGPNAGHTIEFDHQKYVLHTIPSGVFHPECLNIIGNGVVIDPHSFLLEVNSLGMGLKSLRSSLLISGRAHLILPTHRLLDMASEFCKGEKMIGSTLKGIGPAYTDKVAREGLRLADTRRGDFHERYQALKNRHLNLVRHMGADKDTFIPSGFNLDEYEAGWFEGLELISNLTLIDSDVYINDLLQKGVKVLAEGAQGTLLDIDFGSYPFVTSSNTVSAGACTGLGIPPSGIGEVTGVFKAYCTRVGNGPFPTELHDQDGEKMRRYGNEFGSTTGRPRRCGWLDLPALKYAVMINGVSRLIMTKADVLNDFESIRVCTGYLFKNEPVHHMPAIYTADEVQPVFVTLKGWQTDIGKCSSINELPPNLLEYIRFVEDYTGVRIEMVSTGPDRSSILT